MKHTLYIIVILFFCLSASSQEISINANFPAQIELRKNYTVEIIIKKSDLTSFAEYKQKFPVGFNVENNTSNSSIFSYEENLLTYSWNNLPQDSILKIKYTISTTKFNTEQFQFQGVFSYIVNNKRGAISTGNATYSVTTKDKIQTAKRNEKGKKQPDLMDDESIKNFIEENK